MINVSQGQIFKQRIRVSSRDRKIEKIHSVVNEEQYTGPHWLK